MNQNGDERKIRQLFHEIAREEQLLVPDFANLLTGRTKRYHPARTRWSVRFAAAVIACLILVFIFRSGMTADRKELDQSSMGAATTSDAVVRSEKNDVAININNSEKHVRATRVRQHHRRFSLRAAMKSISSWQSPTAVLLQTPRDDALMLPRLGESLRTIQPFSPDQFN